MSLDDTEENGSNDSIRMSAVKVLATRSTPQKDPSEQIANPGEPAAKKLKCQFSCFLLLVGWYCCCNFTFFFFFAAHKESMFVTLSAITDEDMLCLKDYLRQQYSSEVRKRTSFSFLFSPDGKHDRSFFSLFLSFFQRLNSFIKQINGLMAEKQFEQTVSSPDKFSLSELELELGSSKFLVLTTFLTSKPILNLLLFLP